MFNGARELHQVRRSRWNLFFDISASARQPEAFPLAAIGTASVIVLA
jgi:hypothetical protein